MASLTSRGLSGLLWMTSSSALMLLFRFTAIVVLARLLTPTDFGLFALALPVVTLSTIISELGIGVAVVQRHSLTTKHKHAAYAMSLLLGGLLFLCLCLSGPALARFFDAPQLTAVVGVLAVTVLARSLVVVSEAVMQRELRFAVIAKSDIVGAAIGHVGVAVTLAIQGFGLWALVFGQVAEAFVRSAMLLYAARHSFGLSFNSRAWGDLARFATGMSIARASNYLASQIDYFVTGKLLGSEAVGIYSRAFALFLVPVALVGQGLSKVLLPMMSQLQRDEERLRTYYRRTLCLSAMCSLPLAGVIIALGPEIVGVLLGDGWSSAVLPLQVLATGLVFRLGAKACEILITARGAAFRWAGLQVLFAALVAIGAAVGSRWGIEGVALGVTVAIAINFLALAKVAANMLGTSSHEVFFAHVPGLWIGAVTTFSAASVAFFCRSIGVPDLLALLLAAFASSFALAVVLVVAPSLLGRDASWLLEEAAKRSSPRLRTLLTYFQSRVAAPPESGVL